MVPVQCLTAEEYGGEDGEDNERDNLLHHLELHQSEGTSVVDKSDAVGRDLARVLGQGYAPREEDDQIQGPRLDKFHLLQLQVSVPCEGHEDVRYDQQQNSVQCFHFDLIIRLSGGKYSLFFVKLFLFVVQLLRKPVRRGHLPGPERERKDDEQGIYRVAPPTADARLSP